MYHRPVGTGGLWGHLIPKIGTGEFFSEALILASTNPEYDKRLFIELPVQHKNTTSAEHGKNMFRTCSALVV